MTGFVQGEELEELFSNCNIYCLPSDVEGMPISLLEAMSYGCNCLISNIQENVQIADKYSTTFQKGDIEDLKYKLEKILKSDKKVDSEIISNYILKKYNWDKITNKVEILYRG